MNQERNRSGSEAKEAIPDRPLKTALEIIHSRLYKRSSIPAILPGNKDEQNLLKDILEVIDAAQAHTLQISEGQLHSTITIKGVFGGALKNLQSNLRHLTWVTQMIAKGDFTRRVDFLYDFSEAFNSMVRDLDETKKALIIQTRELQLACQSLYHSKEQYRSLILKSPVSICVIKKESITLTNPAFIELLHTQTREDIENRSFLEFVHPDNRESFLNKLACYSESGVNWNMFEEELVCLDGSVIVTKITGAETVYENEPATLLFIDDITERKCEETKVLNSLREKDILLREVYHRVKNNMQIIWSLLSMQARMVQDETIKGYFEECQNRVKSLAFVHEQLYLSDNLREINYGQYLRQFTTHLLNTYNLNKEIVHLQIDADEEAISLAKAVPCSLIINELMSNSLKYAFPLDEGGSISIQFRLSGEPKWYIVDYRDTGPGIPPEVQPEKSTKLGMKLIYGLTRQLNGKVFFENDNGVHYLITFPSEKRLEKNE
jgi:PAS domain S-box-containing protein